MHVEFFLPGMNVITLHDPNSELYIICSGTCEVTRCSSLFFIPVSASMSPFESLFWPFPVISTYGSVSALASYLCSGCRFGLLFDFFP